MELLFQSERFLISLCVGSHLKCLNFEAPKMLSFRPLDSQQYLCLKENVNGKPVASACALLRVDERTSRLESNRGYIFGMGPCYLPLAFS